MSPLRLEKVAMCTRLQHMIGFRNIAVHRYQTLDLAVVQSILQRDLDDILRYSSSVAKLD